MAFKIKIGVKITLLVLAVILMSVTSISVLSFYLSRNWFEEHYHDSFKMMGTIKANQIDAFFINISKLLDHSAHDEDIANNLQIASDLGLNNDTINVEQILQTSLDPIVYPLKNRYEFKNLFITDYFSKIVYKTSDKTESFVYGQPSQRFDNIIDNKAAGHIFGRPMSLPDSSVHIYASTAIRKNNNIIGHVVVEYSLEPIYDIIEDPTGLGALGTSVEINLGFYKNQGSIVYLSRQKKGSKYAPPLTKDFVVDAPHSKALQLAAKGEKSEDFSKSNIDYNGDETLAYWKYLPFMNWGMVVKIDKAEINQEINESILYFVGLGLFVFVISWFVVWVFSRFLTRPLISLKTELEIIAKGGLPININKKSNDEIGEMALAVNELVKALRRTAHFAKLIGEGQYDANYRPLSDNDALGNALISMRNSIQSADRKDNERNWIVSGVAEIGQILRLHNNIADLSNEVIAYVTNKINGVQGAMYVTIDSSVEKESDLEVSMEASYAYNKKKYLQKRFRFAEGLVGQAVAEKDTIMRVEIPDDYVTLTSGLLGDKKPRSILIVPLIANDVVYGVLEFAGFSRFTSTQVHFVEEISVIIARTIFNIRVNQRTYNLLQESQKMSQELKLQQEVLRQNAEEMKATQEELQRTNTRLEEQILEVNRTQQRMQHLLENASEIITIYEKNMSVRYISPSIEPILGYTPEDMIGKLDSQNLTDESAQIFEGMFKELLENPGERLTVQIEYKKKNGTLVLLEATGTNLMADPSIRGIIVNSRDITERIRAEREEKRRSQMQALSENSPDLIVRTNESGLVFYINPIIKNLTGISAEEMMNRPAADTGLNDEIASFWSRTVKDVIEKEGKVTTEMNFPAVHGDRVMQVNAIPEFNDKQDIETVLLVSHDITERKKAEMEIQYKNKKITESINYAKRIQAAMLPDMGVLRANFPDSMMMYVPKDVVSGDFPWLLNMGEDCFVAVGDCTGHGVPGALMSLIGYFILNDVVKTHKVRETGVILDMLHDGVTRTLKQDDEKSTTRDGMDIALVKYNQNQNLLEFSSAHRPLYHLTEGELIQIKGEKFPVGGGANRLHKNFTTHKISIKDGDEIYLMSDGLPDQFGGEANRKFSARRVRQLITDRKRENMKEMNKIFLDEFYGWKMDNNQTDDVLVIGIKF